MFRATLAREYDAARDLAAEVKRRAVELHAASIAGAISFNAIEGFHSYLHMVLGEWARIRTIPGMTNYARAQTGDSIYDVGAEFIAMENAVVATRDWVESNIPKDPQGYWVVYRWDAAHQRETRSFTTVQTAGLRTQLDVLISEID